MPGSDDRFARQNRCGPPPEFPLASPCPGIVHHLSGPIARAPAPPPRRCGRGGPVVRPALGGAGIPPGAARAALHFHCATGFRASPPTRARVRLLGPCFKTGLVGSRHRRGPLAPRVRGPVPARAARCSQDALGTVRPGRQPRRERGAPSPPAGGDGAEIPFHGPGGKRRGRGDARCKGRRG